jgi:quercetin dioxygenase-like cupin family protein
MSQDYATILRPSEGIQIVHDITHQFGVDTLEGKIGPLILGGKGQAHYIDLPPQSFTPEHAHPTESIIYTVRGRWVLCSSGIRHLMQPGTLYWFGADVSTGYEVPFEEPAYILIFKSERSESAESFVDYLQNTLAPRLVAEHEAGEPVLLSELPDDHPARVFARTLA